MLVVGRNQTILKLILIFILFFTSNFCFSQIDTTKTSFIKNNYKVQYPKTWRLDTSRVMGSEFFISSPLQNETDKIRASVNLIIQNLTGKDIDLEKYKQITDIQLTDMLNDGKIYESSILKKADKEYYKAIYAMTQGKYRIKVTSICFIKNDKAYLVTFGSMIDKYEQYQKYGEEILNSFEFIDE